jgi:recombinational DNA repair protein RecR
LKHAEEIGSKADFLTHTEEVFKMATDKLFSVAGISKLNGEYKVRFANDIMRIKVLAKHGHEDIRLADLEQDVSKLEAARIILAMEDFADALAQATITEYIEDKTPKAKTAPKAAVKAPVKAKTPVKAKVLEDEDAPF